MLFLAAEPDITPNCAGERRRVAYQQPPTPLIELDLT
jgi:hypothetical protein